MGVRLAQGASRAALRTAAQRSVSQRTAPARACGACSSGGDLAAIWRCLTQERPWQTAARRCHWTPPMWSACACWLKCAPVCMGTGIMAMRRGGCMLGSCQFGTSWGCSFTLHMACCLGKACYQCPLMIHRGQMTCLAQVHRNRGEGVEAFLAAQQLAAAAPGYPGLTRLQQELGALALMAQGRQHAQGSSSLRKVMPLIVFRALVP